MKLNIIYDKIIMLLIFSITTVIQLNAQILCDVGSRNVLHQTSANREYSGLAHHSEANIFFMPMDAPVSINGSLKYITAYQNGNIFYSTFNNLSKLEDNDLEGLTYLVDDYFLLVEEDLNYVYFLEYDNSSENFNILSKHDVDINLGSSGDGLEGVSYDPHSKLLFLVREHYQIELFSIPITLPTNTFDGSITISQKQSVILPSSIFSDNNSNTDNDASGLFHLGKIVESSSELSNNLLILSEGLKKVVEFDVTFNASNNLSISYIDEHPLSLENQPEGITVYNGKIYVASEVDSDNPQNNPATLSIYALSNNILSCKILDANCNCLDQPGCTDASACNYNSSATEDDESCIYAQANFDCNNNCLVAEDCEGTCGGSAISNTACNDNNANTINDQYNNNCYCVGDIPGCMDITACNYQPAATVENYTCIYPLNNFDCNDNCLVEVDCEGTCGGLATPGTSCNSNNLNYQYNDDCVCVEICQTEITHSGILASGNYSVSNSILSTANVDQNQQVVYDAGGYIHLDKGFLADSDNGTFLLAKIEGCTQLRKGNTIKQMASIKNYPNPFNGETTIEFEVVQTCKVSLIVTDITGQVVTTVLNEVSKDEGIHQYQFDGNHLVQGIYYCTLIVNEQVSTQKMMLMK